MTKKLKLTYVDYIKFILALYILVILLLQLFTFETFPPSIAGVFSTNEVIAGLLAAALVIVELLSIPYLINMNLKSIHAKISRVLGGISLSLLLIVESIAVSRGVSLMFGTTFDLPAGSWSILLLLALIILYLWVVLASQNSRKLAKQII